MGHHAAFVEQAASELHAEDTGALAVMAKGLGASLVLRGLVSLHCDPRHLVFVLNTTKDEEQQLLADAILLAPAQRVFPDLRLHLLLFQKASSFCTGPVSVRTG